MSFHPTLDWIVSVYFNLFYKRKLDWGAAPMGYWRCYVPSSEWFIGTGWSKRPELIIEVCKWNQAVLWPEKTCVSIPCWPHCSRLRLQLQHWPINSQLRPTAGDSDRLLAHRECQLVLTYNCFHSNTSKLQGTHQLKVIKVGVWSGIKSPGAADKVTILQTAGKGYTTGVLIPKQ